MKNKEIKCATIDLYNYSDVDLGVFYDECITKANEWKANNPGWIFTDKLVLNIFTSGGYYDYESSETHVELYIYRWETDQEVEKRQIEEEKHKERMNIELKRREEASLKRKETLRKKKEAEDLLKQQNEYKDYLTLKAKFE